MAADQARDVPPRRWAPHLFRTRHFAVGQTRKRAWPVFTAATEALMGPELAVARSAPSARHEALAEAGWDEAEVTPVTVRTYAEWRQKPRPSIEEDLVALLDVLRITHGQVAQPSSAIPSGLPRADAVRWVVDYLRAALDAELDAGRISDEDYAFTDEVIAGLAARSPVGERLRQARQRKGLSQEQLAEAVEASLASVVVWERGIRPVDERYRDALARVVSVDPEQLA